MKKHFHIQYHFIFGVYKFSEHIFVKTFLERNILSSAFKTEGGLHNLYFQPML